MTDIAIEVATASATISGRGAGPNQPVRLVDLLRLVPVLVISDCVVRPLWQPAHTILAGSTCHLPTSRIVWARPAGGTEANRPPSEPDRVAKLAHSVAVLTPPFIIRGNLHLAPEADPALAFERLAQGFLPLTDTKVTYCRDEAVCWEAPIIVLNGLKIEAFSLEAAQPAASLAPAASAASPAA